MSQMQVISHRYDQGLADYRAGHTLRDIINVTNVLEKEFDNLSPDATREQRDEVYHGAQSVMVGFLDGFLEDFRHVLRAPNIGRRGPSA